MQKWKRCPHCKKLYDAIYSGGGAVRYYACRTCKYIESCNPDLWTPYTPPDSLMERLKGLPRESDLAKKDY